MKSRKEFFATLFLILALLACNLPGQTAASESTPEPTTVVYVVIEPTGTETALPTETPIPASPTPEVAPEVTLVKNSNCRLGPSEFYVIVDQIAKDKVLPAVGKNADGSWWQVLNATQRECWIFNENTQPNSDFSALPIKEGPVLPAIPGNFFIVDQLCQSALKKFSVTMSWSGGAETDGFRIYRNGDRIIELKASKLNFKDTNAPYNKNISYELEAFNKNGTSQRVVQIVPACK